jgi:hypothetical protein
MKEIESEKQDFSIGCRVLLWLPDVKGNVGGIVLNQKEGRRNRLFLVSTPIDILWVGAVSPFPPASNFKKCLRPHPLLIRRDDLPPEHTRDYLGSWEFICQHPDIDE